MLEYDFHLVEEKWRKQWEKEGLYQTGRQKEGKKYYALTMLPYTSGDLHMGHWYAMAPSDARARYKRMQGYKVLFPMGFDAFGLPAENAAIKHNIHPGKWTYANIRHMRQQLKNMGAMFDWDTEVITCDPDYYKWNQWLFLKFYEKGLAYKKHAPVDWCPNCNTTLAREQVVGDNRACERCDTPVEKRTLDQWFLKTTAYADELLDFSGLNWPEKIRVMQTNWIGRSRGVQFSLKVKDRDEAILVFTTRIETIFGATFIALAPEHPMVAAITAPEQAGAVKNYVRSASRRTEIERLRGPGENDGVFTGAWAVHPYTGRDLPIYVAGYVLMSYGTGSIMAVPAHDQRDFDFARRYGLPVLPVIAPEQGLCDPLPEAWTGPGRLINSGAWSGLASQEAAAGLTEDLLARGLGQAQVNYRLRDWLISRQRYWGTPIPIVYCPDCGPVPVPEEQLPVLLPPDAEFRPTGESPLRFHAGFLHTACPKCGGPAQRETDTMDTFFDSSWYLYRYVSPKEKNRPFDPAAVANWLPVDQYTGGVEHATMHLLYVRFFTKAMRDLGLVSISEPITALFNQGIILGEDGEKMSKSRGNVVAPDDLVNRYGADAVRVYLMFMAPWELGGPWNSEGINGVTRFLNRVARLAMGQEPESRARVVSPDDIQGFLHKTIKRVTEEMECFKFNTMISALMELSAFLAKNRGEGAQGNLLWAQAIDTLLLLLAPLTPVLSEEMWQRRGHKTSVHLQPWPTYDPEAISEKTVTVPIQINGKLRDTMVIPPGLAEEGALKAARGRDKVILALDGKTVIRTVWVPDKLLNLVVK